MRLEDRHLSHKQGGKGNRLQGLAEHMCWTLYIGGLAEHETGAPG